MFGKTVKFLGFLFLDCAIIPAQDWLKLKEILNQNNNQHDHLKVKMSSNFNWFPYHIYSNILIAYYITYVLLY